VTLWLDEDLLGWSFDDASKSGGRPERRGSSQMLSGEQIVAPSACGDYSKKDKDIEGSATVWLTHRWASERFPMDRATPLRISAVTVPAHRRNG
jgi:hypothetical protein